MEHRVSIVIGITSNRGDKWFGQFNVVDSTRSPLYNYILRGSSRNQLFRQFRPIDSTRNQLIVWTYIINRQSPKSFVWTIPINRRSPKSVAWTIQLIQSPKSTADIGFVQGVIIRIYVYVWNTYCQYQIRQYWRTYENIVRSMVVYTRRNSSGELRCGVAVSWNTCARSPLCCANGILFLYT